MVGVGSVQISGRADTQEIELGGLASYDAGDLRSSRARVSVFGSGSATVRVTEHLTASISGSGSIYYFGDPEVNGSVTGSGRIIRSGG